ncbi:MAG: glycosyltransferase family 2 protein [Curvibacter sp.]|jgi:glycosyltransferase involved in cell wall biosynthesis|nr:glycosyltransferase family 2 protein [Curvibacter sp.]
MSEPLLSVVVPVYGCRECLKDLCSRLSTSIRKCVGNDYEIILVNDASPDDPWPLMRTLAAEDGHIRGINLSRNFGQHYAITAGLDHCVGDWVVVMDCDLQDRPEDIPKLYSVALTGYDIVVGVRATRQDTFFKKLGSRLFYRVFDFFTGTTIDNRIGNFGVYSRKVIDSVCAMREQNRSFGLFAVWVGFKRKEVEIDRDGRAAGHSSYTLKKLLRLALDSIVAHSNTLLLLSVKLGLLMSVTSLLAAAWLVVKYLTWGTPLLGWTSLMVTIVFSTGLIIGSIGILGLYIGKIFDEVKGRPLYIIESTTFSEKRGR